MNAAAMLRAAAAGLALAGCATVTERDRPLDVRVGGRVDMAAVAERALDFRGTRVETVDGSWRDRPFAAQAVVKGDGERLTLVLLAPALRLCTVALSRPHALRYERAPQIPAAFDPEYALLDWAFVNLPVADLRSALGPEFEVVDDGVRREVRHRGAAVTVVERAADGAVEVASPLRGYSYTVRPYGTRAGTEKEEME